MTDFLFGEGNRLLVVAAHADDEVLGAGGTMAIARTRGIPMHVVVLSHGASSRPLSVDAEREVKKNRQDATNRAAQHLGATLTLFDLPDNAFETQPFLDLVQILEREMAEFEPSLVLSHFRGDVSRDHQLVSHAVLTATRPVPGRPVGLLSFEVRSSTDWAVGSAAPFDPSLWVALDAAAWQTKLELLEIYADELRPWPHARSIEGVEALAKYRGSQVGVDRAEAFVLHRAVMGGADRVSG